MICNRCGAENADNIQFCCNCGNNLRAAAAPAPAVSPLVYPGATPAQSALKRMGGSGLFLAAVILYSASLLFYFVNALRDNTARLINIQGVDPDLLSAIKPVASVGNAVSLVTGLLLATGLWLFYASARDKRIPSVKTAGLTVIKTVVIISLVFAGILAAVLAALVAVVSTAASLSDSLGTTISGLEGEDILGNQSRMADINAAVIAVVIIAFAIAVAIAVLMIVYYSRIISTVNTLKRIALTGSSTKNVSAFVGVMCYVFGVFNCFGVFSFNLIAAMNSACGGAATILFGVMIFKFRAEYKTGFRTVPVQAVPVYTVPVQAPSPVSEPIPAATEPAVSEPAPASEIPEPPVEPVPAPAAVICSACGTECKPENAFCPNCGNRLK